MAIAGRVAVLQRWSERTIARPLEVKPKPRARVARLGSKGLFDSEAGEMRRCRCAEPLLRVLALSSNLTLHQAPILRIGKSDLTVQGPPILR